jgi:hypothetical protein
MGFDARRRGRGGDNERDCGNRERRNSKARHRRISKTGDRVRTVGGSDTANSRLHRDLGNQFLPALGRIAMCV